MLFLSSSVFSRIGFLIRTVGRPAASDGAGAAAIRSRLQRVGNLIDRFALILTVAGEGHDRQ
jgi:hypothetical protein